MRADAKMFAEQAAVLVDRYDGSMTKLANESGIARATLYRAIYNPEKYIDRETATGIARALGASIEFEGRSVRIFLENTSLGIESRGHAVDSLSEEEFELERRIRVLGDKLRTVDPEIFDITEKMVGAITSMDKEEAISLYEIHEMIIQWGGRARFKRKIQALNELVRPDSMEGQDENLDKG